ncbi:hypothetical protein ACN2XU_02270 [Primorskyibacter sp. 2E107]|uniref:hypothetical protein n=1 Tax=Primorskyibacter sp. 2E107 TaxID=3403458 RepID=UPI003AF7CCFE
MKFVLASAFVVASTLSAHAFGISVTFGGDGEAAVLCTLNDVTVMAQGAADCSKIGGEVTHTVTGAE